MESLELADIACQLIVDFRQNLSLNLVNLAFEERFLACQIFCLITFRESNVNVYFLTGFFSNQLILKTRDELSGTQLQVEVLCLAAVEVNAVYGTIKVQNNGISLFRLASTSGKQATVAVISTSSPFFSSPRFSLG